MKVLYMQVNRRAVAMIELIFAIVVMGIVMLSAPLMLSTATKSSTVSFQQESIAIIAAHSNAIMTYPWDEQNSESKNEYGILATGTGTTSLKREDNLTAGMMRRQKKFAGALVEINASTAVSFGTGVDLDFNSTNVELTRDDVDDFDGNVTRLIIADSAVAITNEGDYLDKNISLSTNVQYYSDASSSLDFSTCQTTGAGCAYSNPGVAGTTTNVKFITTNLTSGNDDKNITMKMFMCNIGTAIPDKAIK